MGDYGFRTDIEPKVTSTEQSVLREVIAKAENQIDEAIKYLEKIDTKSALHLILHWRPCTTKGEDY